MRKKTVSGMIDQNKKGEDKMETTAAIDNVTEMLSRVSKVGARNMDSTVVEGIATALDHKDSKIKDFVAALRVKNKNAAEEILSQVKQHMSARASEIV